MDASKTINALGFFAKRQGGETMNCMKAYKLIWLADRYHLRQYGRTITGDRYFAMQRGLVPSDTKNIVEGENPRRIVVDGLNRTAIQHDKESFSYRFVSDIDQDVFSESDREVLELIWNTYGKLDQWQLSELSHKAPEWKQYESLLKESEEKNSFPVDIDLFFENFDDGYGLFSDSEEKMLATKQYYHLFNI